MVYTPPEVRDHGSLVNLTQSMVSSLDFMSGTPMAALSAPVNPPGDLVGGGDSSGGSDTTTTTTTTIFQADSASPAPAAPTALPVTGTGDSSGTLPNAGDLGDGGGDGGGAPGAGGSGGGGGGPAEAAVTAALPSEGSGSLPFTGMLAGAVAGVGAAATAAGAALRRATRER